MIVTMKHKRHSLALRPFSVLNYLLKEERRSGFFILLAAIVALFAANSPFSEIYTNFIGHKLSLGSVNLDIRHWVSEGLMALFFLVVTLEVKRELIDGELRTWKKASFPVVAAVGGMLMPALIYTSINQSPPTSSGWAIPIATDIAIALGVLALLGSRIPKNLRIFLLALAIIDDIGSIIIIGLLYNRPENAFALVSAFTIIMIMVIYRRQNYWIPVFSLLFVALWYCLTVAGVSGTMAGVITAVLAPLVTSHKHSSKLQSSEKIEDLLIPISAFIVVPLFVFCNAGLDLRQLSLQNSMSIKVFSGVSIGLLLGKPLGIILASMIASSLKITAKPTGISWRQLIGVSFLAGISFTVSLLIADLSFRDFPDLYSASVFGIFVASILAGIFGVCILHSSAKNEKTPRV